MLDNALAQYLQRLVHQDKECMPLGVMAKRLVAEFALGRRKGNTVYFSPHERNEMRLMLSTNGYSLAPVKKADLSRSERLAAGVPNEKTGGGAVKRGRVSIKAVPGKPLCVGGKELDLPPGTHLDANWVDIVDSHGHDVIIVVENYEVFDQLHCVNLSLPGCYDSPLVLYRGDRHESRQDHVKALLEAIDLPVLAFVDIDPQGMLIAVSLKNLAGVIAPPEAVLARLLDAPGTRRRDLFQAQYGGVRKTLDSLPESHAVHRLWGMLQQHRAGVVQEHWIRSELTCQVWRQCRTGDENPLQAPVAIP